MKYIEAVNRHAVLSLVPGEGLDDEARVAITLNIVSYERAIAAFDEELAKAAEKFKGEGFNERMAAFALAVEPPEKPSEEQAKKIEELREDPGFEAFRKEYEDVSRQYVEARRQAMEARELKVCEYPLMKHLPAISRVLPSGGKVTQHRADGSDDRQIDNQAIFAGVVGIASKHK